EVEASRPGPARRAVAERRRPDSRRHTSVAQPREPVLQRASESGDDRIESALPLDKFDDFVIEEAGVGAHANRPHGLRQFGKSKLQQRNGDRRGVDVARMIAALPTVLRPSLEAQQRKVGGTPALFRVVAHFGSFLMAVDRQYGAVQIEHRSRRVRQHRGAPAVVQSQQSTAPLLSEQLQEASKTGALGIPRQAHQIMKDAIVPQRFGRLDSSQTQDEWIEQRLQGFADAVAVVALSKSNCRHTAPCKRMRWKNCSIKATPPN